MPKSCGLHTADNVKPIDGRRQMNGPIVCNAVRYWLRHQRAVTVHPEIFGGFPTRVVRVGSPLPLPTLQSKGLDVANCLSVSTDHISGVKTLTEEFVRHGVIHPPASPVVFHCHLLVQLHRLCFPPP